MRNTRSLLNKVMPAAAALLCAWPAAAQWSGKGEAGIAVASGNTETKTANARIAIARKVEAWEHSGTLAGLYVRNEGETTARRWELGAQSRYTFGGGAFWFAGGRYEEDRFSGFDHQGVVNTGAGRHFINNDRTRLLAQAGVGFKFFEKLPTLTEPGGSETSIAGVASMEFEHKFTATTTLYDRFGGEFTSDNNFLQNEIGVAVKMTDRLALALAYAVRHNTDPPDGFKKTDTLSTVNLVYEVK